MWLLITSLLALGLMASVALLTKDSGNLFLLIQKHKTMEIVLFIINWVFILLTITFALLFAIVLAYVNHFKSNGVVG